MKLLLAVDDSNFSEAATKAVISQYPKEGTNVQVLNVVDPSLPIPASYADEFRLESLKHGREVLARTADKLARAGFKVEAELDEGDPKAKIIEHAASWHADMIVMGSHGRRGIDHFLMGSVSEAVVRHAPCSVEVVRPEAV